MTTLVGHLEIENNLDGLTALRQRLPLPWGLLWVVGVEADIRLEAQRCVPQQAALVFRIVETRL